MFLEILSIQPTAIFSYSTVYEPFIDKSIAYHQEPHQFRVKTFVLPNNPHQTVVLLHYKMWSHSKSWLPLPDMEESDHEIQQNTEINANVKKRKMCRYQVTKGQRSAQTKSLLKSSSQPSPDKVDDQDIPENLKFQDDCANGVFDENIDMETRPTATSQHGLKGILWIYDSPLLDSVPFLSFDKDEIEKNVKRATHVFDFIHTKYCVLYANIFSDSVMAN
jgi:hypothetical protein